MQRSNSAAGERQPAEALATTLWPVALRRDGEHVSALDVLRVGALAMPPALMAVLLLLWPGCRRRPGPRRPAAGGY
jgi:Na+/H+ antiporter NhaD/arsenite permease-like protein